MDLEQVFAEVIKRSGKYEIVAQQKYIDLQKSGDAEDVKQGKLFKLLQNENTDWAQGVLNDFFAV